MILKYRNTHSASQTGPASKRAAQAEPEPLHRLHEIVNFHAALSSVVKEAPPHFVEGFKEDEQCILHSVQQDVGVGAEFGGCSMCADSGGERRIGSAVLCRAVSSCVPLAESNGG